MNTFFRIEDSHYDARQATVMEFRSNIVKINDVNIIDTVLQNRVTVRNNHADIRHNRMDTIKNRAWARSNNANVRAHHLGGAFDTPQAGGIPLLQPVPAPPVLAGLQLNNIVPIAVGSHLLASSIASIAPIIGTGLAEGIKTVVTMTTSNNDTPTPTTPEASNALQALPLIPTEDRIVPQAQASELHGSGGGWNDNTMSPTSDNTRGYTPARRQGERFVEGRQGIDDSVETRMNNFDEWSSSLNNGSFDSDLGYDYNSNAYNPRAGSITEALDNKALVEPPLETTSNNNSINPNSIDDNASATIDNTVPLVDGADSNAIVTPGHTGNDDISPSPVNFVEWLRKLLKF